MKAVNLRAQLKVLIIDDDRVTAKLEKDILREGGFRDVETCGSGGEALELSTTNPADIYVVDLVLPDMDGIELIKKLQDINDDGKFIIVTGYGDTDSAIKAIKHGVIDFIKKPVSKNKLLNAIVNAENMINLERERFCFLESLQNKVNKLKLVHDVIAAITSSMDNDKLIKQIMSRVKEFLMADGCSLFLYDSENGELYFEEVMGGAGEKLKEIRLKLGEGIAGKCAQERRSYLINDVYSSPFFTPAADIKTGYKTRNIMAVPLIYRDELLGVIEVINKKNGESFTQDDLEFLEILAKHISIALAHACTIKERERAREIEKMKRNEMENLLSVKMKELEEVSNKLAQTDKLTSLGELVAGVAHELNNPLSFISGNAEIFNDYLDRINSLLEEDNAEQKVKTLLSELKEMADEIVEGSKRAIEIVKNLRRFSRSDPDIKEDVNIKYIFEMAEKILLPKLSQPGVNYSSEIEDAVVRGSECQLTQVVLNILSNAVDAVMEKGGGSITSRCSLKNRCAIIEISDTGIGMDESVRRKIFDPFFTTKPPGKGTGLGLSIVYKIVKDHGGNVEVESAKGKGTVFRVTIPAYHNVHQKVNEEEV